MSALIIEEQQAVFAAKYAVSKAIGFLKLFPEFRGRKKGNTSQFKYEYDISQSSGAPVLNISATGMKNNISRELEVSIFIGGDEVGSHSIYASGTLHVCGKGMINGNVCCGRLLNTIGNAVINGDIYYREVIDVDDSLIINGSVTREPFCPVKTINSNELVPNYSHNNRIYGAERVICGGTGRIKKFAPEQDIKNNALGIYYFENMEDTRSTVEINCIDLRGTLVVKGYDLILRGDVSIAPYDNMPALISDCSIEIETPDCLNRGAKDGAVSVSDRSVSGDICAAGNFRGKGYFIIDGRLIAANILLAGEYLIKGKNSSFSRRKSVINA